MKRRFAFVLAAALSIGMLAGCGPKTPANNSASSSGDVSGSVSGDRSIPQSSTEKFSADNNPLVTDKDTVIFSLASDLESLNPITTSTIVTNEVQKNAYEGLVNYDLEGNVLPGIADSWEYDADTYTYTLHLRDDVYFHDGSKLTSEDVAFSMEVGKETGRMSLSCNYIETITIVDETTLTVTLNANYSPFLYFLAINLPIICKESYEAGILDDHINGTGPYKMVSYTPGDRVVFEANDQYYGGKPAIQNLIFKIVPDANTQYIALESGELNLSRDFSMNNIQDILDNPQLDIYQGESGNVYYVGMNQSNEVLQDVRVRQAINYAIDREFIIEVCEEGYAELANSIANKGMFGYTEDAKYYEYDPEKAKQLLADAGYADGLTFDIPILCKDGKFKKAAEVIKEDLAAVGINIEIGVRDAAGFTDDFNKGNFVLCVTSINLSQDAHHVTMCFSSTGYLNKCNINDPELDALGEKAAQEQDTETRRQLYHDILCKVADDALFAPIYYPKKVWAVTSGLHNSTYDRYVGVLAEYMTWE